MKTFKQLQENIGKALAKFGVKGLRKITSQVTKKGNTKTDFLSQYLNYDNDDLLNIYQIPF